MITRMYQRYLIRESHVTTVLMACPTCTRQWQGELNMTSHQLEQLHFRHHSVNVAHSMHGRFLTYMCGTYLT